MASVKQFAILHLFHQPQDKKPLPISKINKKPPAHKHRGKPNYEIPGVEAG
jgi:hypothetical protein